MKNTITNAMTIKTEKKFNLTVIVSDNFYLAFELFVLFSNRRYNYKTKNEYHFYYKYCDKLQNDIQQILGYDINTKINVTALVSVYEYNNLKTYFFKILKENINIQIC